MARHRFIPPRRPVKEKKTEAILLDQYSSKDINKFNEIRDKVLKFHWDFYSNLAFQRSRVQDQIRETLHQACEKNFEFTRWQRTVRYKYSNEPLSVVGSLKDQAGGRFNIGDINPSQFPSFPALYIAQDRETCLQELLCQHINPKQSQDAFDFALASKESISHLSISGKLGSVINLNEIDRLEPFLDLFKDFNIPDHLKKTANELGIAEPLLIKTVSKLIKVLRDPAWRKAPMQFDVPATPQIFGQLVNEAGIEGILFNSKFSEKECLAIFPQNFDESSGSFVELDDAAPKETKIVRWDAHTWQEYKKG